MTENIDTIALELMAYLNTQPASKTFAAFQLSPNRVMLLRWTKGLFWSYEVYVTQPMPEQTVAKDNP
jgi:hypothetical protein